MLPWVMPWWPLHTSCFTYRTSTTASCLGSSHSPCSLWFPAIFLQTIEWLSESDTISISLSVSRQGRRSEIRVSSRRSKVNYYLLWERDRVQKDKSCWRTQCHNSTQRSRDGWGRKRKQEEENRETTEPKKSRKKTSTADFDPLSLFLFLFLSLSLSRVYLVCQASLDVTLFCETCSSLLLLLHLPFTAWCSFSCFFSLNC